MAANWQRKEFKARNKPMDKMGREPLEAALAAHDRIQAISDEIRARHGLPIVPESPRIMAARSRLLQLQSKGSRKAPSKARKAKPRELTPDERLKAVAERRSELRKALAETTREVCELRDSKEVPVTVIASALGVKRQAVYQLCPA